MLGLNSCSQVPSSSVPGNRKTGVVAKKPGQGSNVASVSTNSEEDLERQIKTRVAGRKQDLHLKEIVKRLVRGRKFEKLEWRVIVVSSSDPNALVSPDGTIYCTSGLQNLVTSDDEMAAALAHEIAHIELGHFKKRQLRPWLIGIPLVIGKIAMEIFIYERMHSMSKMNALQEGVGWEMLRSTAAPVVGGAALYLLVKCGNQSDEIQADKTSLRMMIDAGFQPEAALSLWEKFVAYDKEHLRESITHPSNEKRLEALKKTIEKLRLTK